MTNCFYKKMLNRLINRLEELKMLVSIDKFLNILKV